MSVAVVRLPPLREPGELAIEIKMQGDARGLAPFDRACMRRYARQVQRREDPKDRFKGELPFWFIASTMPPVIRKRRSPEPLAAGCYRIGPEWMGTTWVCANELPLKDELVPFLVARTGPTPMPILPTPRANGYRDAHRSRACPPHHLADVHLHRTRPQLPSLMVIAVADSNRIM